MRHLKLDSLSLIMLKEMHKNHANSVLRQRAFILILLHKNKKIKEVAFLLDVDTKTVSRCLKAWQQSGLMGLYTKVGQGRKPIFSKEESQKVKKIVEQTPRKINLDKIEKETGKTASKTTIKRILKRLRMTWKRVRQSLKAQRDELDFRAAQQELNSLHELDKEGKIDLYYFDESGFSTESNVPYAWQPIGETIGINKAKSKRLNVAGFMKTDNTAEFYTAESSINSSLVVGFFDDFCTDLQKRYEEEQSHKVAYIIIDNATMHTSKLFKERIKVWEAKGNIIIKRLPTYSPELNLIEILWKFMKYEWLPLDSHEKYNKLKNNVIHILKSFGTGKHTINFA